tara:strand:+ start:398 stop:1498 length:1101 start_codon:yes stop_codon:yes gene_type:complete
MKINLFFFISRFTFGGAGNAIYTFLKTLDRKKYNLHIFFLGKSEYQTILPKHVKYLRLNNKISIFKTFFSFIQIRKVMLVNSKKFKKNIFISNIHYSNVLSILFLRDIKNLKIILFERTSIKELDIFINKVTYIKNKIIKLLIKWTYNKANKILTNSKVLSSELKELGIKSEVVYSGSIENIRKIKKFKKKSFFKIISVGRLTEQKDYFTLLKAIRILKNKNLELNIFGEGFLKNELINFIKKNNLQDIVKLRGHIFNKAKIYKKADLLIHTAIFEGLPNVIVEAMNYGVPVIAADSYGGTREVLSSGKYGELFKPKNFKSLANKIDQFMLSPEKLNQKILNSKLILERFTYKNSTKSLEKILKKI